MSTEIEWRIIEPFITMANTCIYRNKETSCYLVKQHSRPFNIYLAIWLNIISSQLNPTTGASVPQDHLCLFKIAGLQPALALQMFNVYAAFASVRASRTETFHFASLLTTRTSVPHSHSPRFVPHEPKYSTCHLCLSKIAGLQPALAPQMFNVYVRLGSCPTNRNIPLVTWAF
jgi:hypothetical protein